MSNTYSKNFRVLDKKYDDYSEKNTKKEKSNKINNKKLKSAIKCKNITILYDLYENE